MRLNKITFLYISVKPTEWMISSIGIHKSVSHTKVNRSKEDCKRSVQMRYSDYKKEVFAENPEVKEEYDRLEPQYEVIRAAIASRKAAGLTQKQLAEKMGTKQTSHALKTGMPTLRWSFCKKWRLVWARRCTSPLCDGIRPHRATGAVFSVPACFFRNWRI